MHDYKAFQERHEVVLFFPILCTPFTTPSWIQIKHESFFYDFYTILYLYPNHCYYILLMNNQPDEIQVIKEHLREIANYY
jgi:hypothetical protein